MAAVDEIALVAAPGATTADILAKLAIHCRWQRDRMAILDASSQADRHDASSFCPLDHSRYAAVYYPWLQVADPATKMSSDTAGRITMPPSGHVAGIYARVDAAHGVHKAPDNEVVLGALGLETHLDETDQVTLNAAGVNCIRALNGHIQVCGAYTWGGDANGVWKHINVRRLLFYLQWSLEKGLAWTAFESHTPDLWPKIVQAASAFLTAAWHDKALLGKTPEDAFYVRCDEALNPPNVRDQGQVITEIGVAPVKPAEFIVFRIAEAAGPGK